MASPLALSRLFATVVAALLLVWALLFRSSFLPAASPPTHTDHLYSVLHPLLMVIGFILLSGEATLAHRSMAAQSPVARKAAHLAMQGAALGLGLFGIWAKFKGGIGISANFYSLHSWMGLTCVCLFAAQWTVGFVNFWDRVEGRRTRATVLPWHVFVGLYTYGLAVATAETGLLEKQAFLQTKHSLPRRSTEATLVNALGVSLAFLCGLVIFAAISPKPRGDPQYQHLRFAAGHQNSGYSYRPAEYRNAKWISP